MSFVRAAARAALASGALVVFGASCKPERMTSPERELEAAPALRASTSRGVKILTAPDTLALGETVQLNLQGGGVATKLRGTDGAVTWTSLDSTVLNVNSTGAVTAVGGGDGKVVAVSGDAADTVAMYVSVSVAAVVASPDNGSVTVGQTSQLTAVVNDGLGQPVSGATIAWSTTNAAVATVSSSGVVTGVSVGAAGIVAASGDHADTVNVTVTAVAVASVSVSPTTVSVGAGATAQLTATAKDAAGATLSGRLVTWKSSDAKVATVDAAGKLSGVAVGTATVTATVDGKSASSAVTVTSAPVTSVAVALNAASLSVGQTTQATATSKDAAGNTLSGRTVSWSSSDTKIATVSSSGLVTAVAAGSATVTATVENVKGSAAVAVSTVAVASVSVAINSSSVNVGQSTQATATALDASGKAITGRSVTWSSSNAGIATVDANGTVTGVAAGSVSISATVDGKSGQANIGVTSTTTTTTTTPTTTAPPPTGTTAVLPELPRYRVDYSKSSMVSNGSTIRVAAGGNLQGALDSAQPGDVILLAPGASFTGNFILRAKSGASSSAWITIRTETTLPIEGTRVTPAAASSYAKILTPNAEPALHTDPGASYYRISGVEISSAPNLTMVYTLVALGADRTSQRTLSSVPHHLEIDRAYVHGRSTLDLRRCVAVNSAWTAVVDSWLSECHSNEGDAQAIWGANGPGPFAIVNNRLEGSGENIMFGGSDSYSVDFMPGDITVQRNHVIKPAAWKGVWTVKNLFELKAARRVLIEQNVFEGNWENGQNGIAFLVKSVNQDGSAPWSETSDVTLRWNSFTRTAGGFSFAGAPESMYNPVTTPARRVLAEQNYIAPLGDPSLGGTGIQILMSAMSDVIFRHNTMSGTSPAVYFSDGTQTGFVYTDNIASGGNYRWGFASSDGHGTGTVALDYHAPGWIARGNCLFATDEAGVTGNIYPTSISEAGFVNPTSGDFTLSSSSPCKSKATDGTDPGVDMNRLNSMLQGVVVQ